MKLAKRIAKSAALVLAAALLATFLIPLGVRGARFANLVQGFLPPMRGSMRFDSGHLGAMAFWAYVFGRPIPVRIDGLSIRDPEGVEVLKSEHLTASIEFQRYPLRVFLHDLKPGKAMWRFARMKNERGIGFLRAFASPARPQPTPPPPAPPAAPPRAPAPAGPPQPPRAAFGIASADLNGLDAIFDFWGWGLELSDIRAHGFLRVELGTGRPPITFDARDVNARKGGHLRILGGTRATVIPFDRAQITRVGTPAEGPANLLLQVAAAMTGASKLSGEALFPNLFPGRPPGSSRGLVVDATWEQAGAGLTAAASSHRISGLKITGDKAQLRARVKSSFRDIDGSFATSGLNVDYRGFHVNDLGFDLSIVGPPARVAVDHLRFAAPAGGQVSGSASLDKDGAARFDLQLGEFVTAGVLPPYLLPLFGGTARGALSLKGDLRARRAELVGVDLALDRTRRGPFPQHLRVVGGEKTAAAAGRDEFLVRVGALNFERGRLEATRVNAFLDGAEVRAGPLRLTIPELRDDKNGPPELDLAFSVRNLDLKRTLPGTGLSGRLGFSSRVRGPLDDVALGVFFPRAAAITVFDQDYGLPASLRLGIRGGDELVVPTLKLAAPGGGNLSFTGRLVLDRTVDLALTAEGHRLDRVPFISRVLPSLGGIVAGRLHLFGHPLRPTLEGSVDLARVNLAGVPLGAGGVKLVAQGPGRSALKGTFFEQLSVAGDLDVGSAGPAFYAVVDAKALSLDPFLPDLPVLRGGRLRVGGRFTLAAHAGHPLELGAALNSVLFAYGCRGPDPRGPGCVVLENRGPMKARTRGGAKHIELDRADFVAPGTTFSVDGRLDGSAIDARVEGRLSLAVLTPLFQIGNRRFGESSGVVDFSLAAKGSVRGPTLKGEAEVIEPVRVASTLARLEVRLPSGHVAFDPARISSRGVKVELPGVKLAVAGEVPTNLVAAFTGPGDGRQKPIKLDLTGSLDAALLARIAPTFIADARGSIEVAGKVSGTADNPHLDAEAMVANGKGVTVVTRGNKTQPAFRIAVSGGQVVAKGKRVSVSQLAAVATPGGELVIGPKGRPAELDLVRLYPAEIARVSLPVVGRGLNLDLGWMRLDDGRLDLKLSGDPRRALALGGEVELGAGRVSPTKRPPPPPPPPRAAPGPTGPRPAGPAPTPIMLDVRVKSDGERFVVDPGWLPDVHLGFNVKVGGTLTRPAIAWDAEGRGLYSTIALWLFRLFS